VGKMKNGRYLNSVRCALPDGAQSFLDLAFSGDALAARRLMVMAPKRLRGHIAFLAYQVKTRNPAYREIMKSVWAPSSRHLLIAHWPPQIVRRMLARADFRIPDLNAPVSVYRPASGMTVKRAAAALSWLLSRDDAIAEAVRADANRPRILKATIDPSDIIYFGNGRGEHEVVSRRPVPAHVIEEVKAVEEPHRRRTSHQR
jgi:hypothetical protein